MELALLIDTLGTVAGGLTAIGALLLTVYVFARKRVRKWWKPIREGIEGARQVPEMRKEVTTLSGNVRILHLRMAARANFSENAECDFDAERRMTTVNATLARKLGVGKKELEGFGYIGFIVDAESFRTLHKQCADEHRVMDWRGDWRTATGTLVPMHWLLTPIPEPPETPETPIPEPPETPIQMWAGVGEFE